MRHSLKHNSISAFSAMVVFGLFALCILCVLLSGAGAYRRLVQRGQDSYVQRTCAQYVATRARQCEGPDSLRVGSFGDGDALVLEEELEGERYLTRVYCHDGWLMELFASQDGAFAPGDGEKLFPAQGFDAALEDGFLRVQIVNEDGDETKLVFSLRGGKGDGA